MVFREVRFAFVQSSVACGDGDAHVGGDALARRRQLGYAAGRVHTLHAGAVEKGDAGRVIATVFALAQALEQDGDDAGGRRDGCDDSAHGVRPSAWRWSGQRCRATTHEQGPA